MLLSRLPRTRMCHLPTALEPLPALSRHLGGPDIWVKRDDCTGLGQGGNKSRKLEFLVADAQAKGADTLITAGGIQSNHCRQTAAAARNGMACELVLSRRVPWNHPDYERNGNVLLDRLAGATSHIVAGDADPLVEMERVAEAVRSRGGSPYVMPPGGSTPVGTLGYIGCAQELTAQMDAMDLQFDALVHATGSGATQGGLLAGLHGTRTELPVIGIAVLYGDIAGKVQGLADRSLALLGAGDAVPAERVEVLDAYVGEAYGLPTPGMVEAVQLCARLEGLFLDPVYTGKAMAGLIDLVRQGRFAKGQTVLFLHTGGVPALFTYETAFPE